MEFESSIRIPSHMTLKHSKGGALPGSYGRKAYFMDLKRKIKLQSDLY